ncbi:MAG: Gx transporter family protein [Eubacteriales bacterium]|nr:Gx transporter family protein [Eubacteriales bacterium]
MEKHRNTSKIALRGLLIALAMVLSWVEAQIPVFTAVPGMKLGLTNLVVLVALYRLGSKDALFLNFVRVLLVGLTFGNMVSFVYSLAGGMLSGCLMIILKRVKWFSVTTVSLAGGVFHNVGQILVAMVILETSSLIYYLPFLWIGGMVSGILIGILGARIIKRLPDLDGTWQECVKDHEKK